MDAAEIPERTDHQGCANQQHQRQGDFGGDEQSARALAGGGRIEPPQPLLQRLVRIRFRHPPCRCHAGDRSTQQRRCERKREDRAVHLDVGQPGQAVAKVIHDQPGPEMRDDQSQGSPTHRQQQALRQHLPDDPGALRAKRRADGNLLPAIDTSREHQVRNVRARDQQHEHDRAKQHEKRLPDITHGLFTKRHNRRAPTRRIRRVLLGDSRGNGVQLRLRLLNGDTWLESCDCGHAVLASHCLLLRRPHKGHPERGRFGFRK